MKNCLKEVRRQELLMDFRRAIVLSTAPYSCRCWRMWRVYADSGVLCLMYRVCCLKHRLRLCWFGQHTLFHMLHVKLHRHHVCHKRKKGVRSWWVWRVLRPWLKRHKTAFTLQHDRADWVDSELSSIQSYCRPATLLAGPTSHLVRTSRGAVQVCSHYTPGNQV
jgi:hypothetical protein